MNTAKTVAEWMLKQLDGEETYLYQEVVVYQIRDIYGDEFVYLNENENLAIDKRILKEFRRISEGIVVWDRGEFAWRKIKPTEEFKGRQID